MTTTTTFLMRASFRLAYGGEDLQRLRQELATTLPSSRIEDLPTTEDDPVARVAWEHPVLSVYGEDCFATWNSFRDCVKRAFGPAACEEDLYCERFSVSADGELVGCLARSEDAGGIRDFLEGPVYCGTALDLLMPDGTWLEGHYELAWDTDRTPLFVFPAWGAEVTVPITESMVVRRTTLGASGLPRLRG